jgi:transcriptional regulator with XRE-family HTH domain
MVRLEFERRKMGLSQKDLGERMFYCGERIGWLERPNRTPKDVNRRFKKVLEDFFGLPLEKLLEPVE